MTKPLFERLSNLKSWNVNDSIRLSLDQIATSSYVQESGAPEGIYNFGLRNPIELGNNEKDRKLYALALQRRIEAFEPRIQVNSLDVVNNSVVLEATIKATNEAFNWRL